MNDVSKGRYWDKPWSLVDGCTPCSPGCDHCWSAAMMHRFHSFWVSRNHLPLIANGKFTGEIYTRPERLSIPLKRRKPTVYAVWNDLFHEAVPFQFQLDAWLAMEQSQQHTFLLLTKRPEQMAYFFKALYRQPLDRSGIPVLDNLWPGITVCNQKEADEKIPVFLQVPGKKFLSIEPMLGAVDLQYPTFNGADSIESLEGIDVVILGGETGPGARPMRPDWVRSVRDQCAVAGVPFFFKGWGDDFFMIRKVSKKNFGNIRTLDGRTHDDLPWNSSGLAQEKQEETL